MLFDENGPLRMWIALKVLRAWGHRTEHNDGWTIVQTIHDWIDGGMKGPVPWPECPLFEQWARDNGYSKIDGQWVGWRLEVKLGYTGI